MIAKKEQYEYFIGDTCINIEPEGNDLSKKPHLVLWKKSDNETKLPDGSTGLWDDPETIEFNDMDNLALAQAAIEIFNHAISVDAELSE